MPIDCHSEEITLEDRCNVVGARVFQVTESGIRWLWTSQDLDGNGVQTTGTLWYRELGDPIWTALPQAGTSSSFNVVELGLTPNTTYEWYAESCLPDGSCCTSSINQVMTLGDTPPPTGDCTIKANNDYAAWEIELEPAFNGWIEQAANANTSGPWYSWQGGNNFFLAEAGEDIIKYNVCITQAGVYQFKIHSFSDTSANPNRPDLANDVWVRFPTGTDVAGQVDAVQGWIKAFRNGSLANQWSWVTQAEHSGNQWATVQQFFSAGDHCIEISGRSNGHGIDRFALCRVGTNLNPDTLAPSPLIDCNQASKSLPTASLYQNCDLIALHYDVSPDLDDLQAIAAGCSLSRCFDIDPCVVIGTYGLDDPQRAVQYNDPNSSKLGQTTAAFNNVSRRDMAISVANAAYGAGNYLDTGGGNWTNAVNAQADKWKPVIQSGCTVYVAEGGPSDFTSDVLRRLLALGCTSAQIKASVTVIQHADPGFNANETIPANLNYVENAANYVTIPNGNNSNANADLEDASVNTTTSSFAVWARNSECGAAWAAALDRFSSKVDFSDTVEYLHILAVPTGSVNNVDDFCDYVD